MGRPCTGAPQVGRGRQSLESAPVAFEVGQDPDHRDSCTPPDSSASMTTRPLLQPTTSRSAGETAASRRKASLGRLARGLDE